MKKKLLLTFIPALMLLGACAGAAPEVPAALEVENQFQEDNLAHEEIFGGEAKYDNEVKLEKNRLRTGEVLKPKIGVQFKLNEDTGKATVRYVAAISGRNVTAKWVRGMATQEGAAPLAKQVYDEEKKEYVYNYKESTVAYTSLNENGTKIVPQDLGEGYNFFVVYTLYNITYETYKYSYMAAYLELNEGEYTSDVLAVEVGTHGDGSAHHYFSFDKDDVDGGATEATSGYFLEGTLNGSANSKLILDDSVSGTTDKAKKTGLALAAKDNFGVFLWTDSAFNYYGNSNFSYDDRYLKNDSTISTNYSKVGGNSTYSIYINKDWRFGLTPEAAVLVDLYLEVTNWSPAGARFALCSFDPSDSWFGFAATEITNLYVIRDFDISNNNAIILCRMNGATVENNWDNKWNQTANIYYWQDEAHVFSGNNLFTMEGCIGQTDPYTRTEYGA